MAMDGSVAEWGFPHLLVRVEMVTVSTAFCIALDLANKPIDVPITYRRAKGMLPQVGERWLLDKSQGFYSFSICLVDNPPIVTGSTDGIPALVSLIQILAANHMIIDGTTATRVRSTLGHTHSDPQGGSTGADAP